MAIVEVKILPLAADSPSYSSIVARCVEEVASAGLEYQVTPTSTVIEGDLDRVLEVVKAMHHQPFQAGINRVVTSITIDERQDKPQDMDDMTGALKERTISTPLV